MVCMSTLSHEAAKTICIDAGLGEIHKYNKSCQEYLTAHFNQNLVLNILQPRLDLTSGFVLFCSIARGPQSDTGCNNNLLQHNGRHVVRAWCTAYTAYNSDTAL